MSQHCRHCDGGPNIDYPCLGFSCGHEAELAALRAALAEAEEMAKLLTTKCQYALHSDRASLLAARYYAAREKVGK